MDKKKTFLFEAREPKIGYILREKNVGGFGSEDAVAYCDWGNGKASGKLTLVFEDGGLILLKGVKIDIKNWCKKKHHEADCAQQELLKQGSTKNNDLIAQWLCLVDYDFKEIFKEIVSLMAQLSPMYYKSGCMGEIPILYEGNFYQMRYKGKEEYKRDMNRLRQTILTVLLRLPPEELKTLDEEYETGQTGEGWAMTTHERNKYFKDKRLMKFASIIRDIEHFTKSGIEVPLYGPYFWDPKRRKLFMEGIYDIFWVEEEFNRFGVRQLLNGCYPPMWDWMKLVPKGGAWDRTLNYEKDSKSKFKYTMDVDTILFWRNCRFHHNHNVDSKRERHKTVKQLEEEMNELFNIPGHTYSAVCVFINDIHIKMNKHDGFMLQRLIALGEEFGFFPISIPKANT